MHNLPVWTRQHKPSRSSRFVVPVLSSAVIGYFVFHAYQGEYGVYSKLEGEKRVAELQVQLADTTRAHAELEKRVQLLRDGSLEHDMVDEYARRSLDYTRSDELVIMLPPISK